jgi:transposase-like protein
VIFKGKLAIEVRQIKYLNNIVEQDQRSVKRNTKPMLRFISFHTARAVLAGVELMHLIRKGQKNIEKGEKPTFTEQFYALAS